jgi:hypothetical protein
LLADSNAGTASHDRALVNRYSVDRVDSDLMLGFFFPGAQIEMPAPPPVFAAGADKKAHRPVESTAEASSPAEPDASAASAT